MPIRWFNDSPDAGDPRCLCSWCGLPIAAGDAPIIRVFDSDADKEARFHFACARPAMGVGEERRAAINGEFEL